ncbi:hypothetical protein HZH68_008981 [Vespula germanica]|uniref:Uncharacterized protein n=1 Tax=Vespula germanica TaxID=30212 RepID=A0A834N7I5_VESGE|nr:hypothetical protein HZH68_008981 [Vespula germanica]
MSGMFVSNLNSFLVVVDTNIRYYREFNLQNEITYKLERETYAKATQRLREVSLWQRNSVTGLFPKHGESVHSPVKQSLSST